MNASHHAFANPPVLAVRAKSILTLAGEGPACGENLFAPLKKIDNAVLLVRNGLVEEVRPWGREALPAGAAVHDLGPVSLIPACVNAHTHLELSHLAGRTIWGRGFAAWLLSLIPLLSEPVDASVNAALEAACADTAGTGTAHLGDFCSRRLGDTARACRAVGLGVTHFCEWFGFQPPFADAERPWPPRLREDAALPDVDAAACAPAGHALYSTAGDVLRDARRRCVQEHKVFSFHLAESAEETEMLSTGRGPLRECYAAVLPPDWRPPCQSPLRWAQTLGLMGPGTLAVHGVHLDAAERADFAASGAALCLCPRSNRNLAVGEAPVHALLESGALLCLGTDGLTSNTDTDVRREALYLREALDVPPEALVRLMTVNGAAALGLSHIGRLMPGTPAVFSLLPEGLTY